MMKKGGKYLIFVLIALAAGFAVGAALRYLSNRQNAKTAAFRIGNEREMADYDLQAAVNYLAYRLEQEGYSVAGMAYGGEMYPPEFNSVGVNVFVRGFLPFYDARLNEKGKNVFYLHRAGDFYEEEMRHYDLYLLSQQRIYEQVKHKLPAELFSGGAVPHKRLEPQYENDVLYIFEDDSDNFSGLLKNSVKAETYGGMVFAALTEAEREAAFKRARVVMYHLMPEKADADYDSHYVPYAAYDIISYGRPLVTNRRAGLEKDFAGKVWLYDSSSDSRIRALQEVLNLADEVREQLAGAAREKLLLLENDKKKIRR